MTTNILRNFSSQEIRAKKQNKKTSIQFPPKPEGLTAGEVEMTGLLVEWEQLEQHRAGDREGDPRQGDRSSRHITLITLITPSPNTIQHVAIRVNPHIQVWSENIMEPSYLLISKETVWLPDFPDIRQCQILDLICNRFNTEF